MSTNHENHEKNHEKDKKEETSLGLKTKVRMDFVILLLSGAASVTLIYGKLTSMQDEMRHNWTIQHEILWSKEMAAENPGLKIPSPQAIVDMMNQRSSP